MTKRFAKQFMAVAAIGALASNAQLHAQENQPPPPQATSQADATVTGEAPASNAEVLDAGPMHEAFLEPADQLDAAPVAVNQEPPATIDEVPPEYKPDGENVQWIPGYWSWDENREDFIWISGVWRNVPQGRRWMPGHWSQVGDQYQWTSGVWIEADRTDVELLPTPPENLEEGPNSPAPSADHIWIPGCWRWRNASYSWTPGFWYPGQANWMWVPNRYVTTPRGCIYVPGYWDYPIARRGLPYASVYWPGRGYARSGFYYRPTSALNTALLITSLFVNSSNRNYYYGYSNAWGNGYYPWFAAPNRGRYNALNNYYRWKNRANEDAWMANIKDNYERHRSQGNRRPRDGQLAGDPQQQNSATDASLVRDVKWLADNSQEGPRLHRISERETQMAKQQVQTSRDLRRNLRDVTSVKDANEAARNNVEGPRSNGRGDVRNRENGREENAVAENGRRAEGRRGAGNEVGNRRETFRLPTADETAFPAQSNSSNARVSVGRERGNPQKSVNSPSSPRTNRAAPDKSIERGNRRPSTPQPPARTRGNNGSANQVPPSRRNNRPNVGNGRGNSGGGRGNGGGGGRGNGGGGGNAGGKGKGKSG